MIIEKNIPIPTVNSQKYPFELMEIGDSFFITGKTTKDLGGILSNFKKKNPTKSFVSRTIDGGVRIWRIK